jgi:Reverse transcriptase (RNA-dependent DNA polymerase)
MNSAQLPWTLSNKLWAQCAKLITQLQNILISKERGDSPYTMLHDKQPDWLNNLHKFGELAIFHDAGEVCQFLNLKTKKLISLRTAIFLHKTYADYYNLAKELISQVKSTTDGPEIDINATKHVTFADDMDIDMLNEPEHEPFEHLVDDLPYDPNHPLLESDTESVDFYNISSSGLRELQNLQTSYNPEPLQHIDGYEPHVANLTVFRNPPEAALNATIYDGSPDPKTYAEAMTSSDRQNWCDAMCTEFANMHTKQVWTIIPKSSIPNSRKIIGNRWVFVQKDDGRIRARTVEKGFAQIPGKDFQENQSSVINDTTFHSVLVLKILFKLKLDSLILKLLFYMVILKRNYGWTYPTDMLIIFEN